MRMTGWLHGNSAGSTNDDRQKQLERGIRRMGRPSWWILEALAAGSNQGMAPFEIIRVVESALRGADYPVQRLGEATTHHAIERMEDDGFLTRSTREVDVPAG